MSRRGSVLIASYFVLAILLGLAIPQTMRSLSSVQLERHFVANRQMWHLTEAGMDDAIRFIWSNPDFGTTGDADFDGTCPAGWTCEANCTGTPGWECVRPPLLPGTSSYQFLAQNDTAYGQNGQEILPGRGDTGGQYASLKRIRVLVTSTAGQASSQVMVVQVRRKYTLNEGMRAVDTALLESGVQYVGNITVHSGATRAVELQQNTIVSGKITVGPASGGLTTNDWDLCCDISDSIYLHYFGGLAYIKNPTNGMVIEDNSNGNSTDWASDLQWNDLDYRPIRSASLPSPPEAIDMPMDANCSPGGDREVAGGTTQTFTVAGSNPRVVDGVYEYCFDSLWVHGNSTARFEGDKVRVIGRKTLPASGPSENVGFSVRLNNGSQLYTYPTGGLGSVNPSFPKLTATPLVVHLPKGTTCGSTACGVWVHDGSTLYGSIWNPEGAVRIGTNASVQPVDSNQNPAGYFVAKDIWVRQGSTVNFGVTSNGANTPGPVEAVTVLGWRKCQTATCTP